MAYQRDDRITPLLRNGVDPSLNLAKLKRVLDGYGKPVTRAEPGHEVTGMLVAAVELFGGFREVAIDTGAHVLVVGSRADMQHIAPGSQISARDYEPSRKTWRTIEDITRYRDIERNL